MTFDYFQGDPALTLDGDGADIKVVGGQPVMDQGLHNAAILSLFVSKGWWGNQVLRAAEEKLGSDFEETCRQAVTVTALQRIRTSMLAALQWLLDTKLASAVEAAVVNPSPGRLDTGVKIIPPSRDELVLVASKHGPNWLMQRDNPAHERLK